MCTSIIEIARAEGMAKRGPMVPAIAVGVAYDHARRAPLGDVITSTSTTRSSTPAGWRQTTLSSRSLAIQLTAGAGPIMPFGVRVARHEASESSLNRLRKKALPEPGSI